MTAEQQIEALKDQIEAAFLAGYGAGYDMGSDDVTSHEWGSSKHYGTKERDKKNAWRDYKQEQINQP